MVSGDAEGVWGMRKFVLTPLAGVFSRRVGALFLSGQVLAEGTVRGFLETPHRDPSRALMSGMLTAMRRDIVE